MRNLFNDVSENITPALDNKVDISSIGVANGVAGLDSNGLIPSSQLPSYVDDVLEYSSLSNFPESGTTGKIYVALDTNKTYRWSGSTYTEISESLALGTTSSTAYRGDWGNEVKTKVGTTTLTTEAQDVSGAVNELNSALSNKANKQTQLSAFYGTCTTDAATQAKVATITDSDDNFSLRAGVCVFIKFTNSNTFSATADTPITLDVNNTGAKQIKSGAYAIATGTNTTYYGRANYINQYIYDGTYWVWAGSSGDNNTTYSNMSTSELTTGTATTQRTVRADYLKTGINSLIDTKIGGLDVASVGGSGKYISAISETNGKISATASNMPTIPDQLSDLTDDSTHRLVTDTEKTTWNDKVDKKTTMDSYYGTSSTAADTAAKVITVTDNGGNFSLRAGISIMVKFSAVNTAQNPTFNVNNTGAKPVFYNTAVVTTGTLWAGGNTRPARYVYDGTNWVWIGQATDSNTTYTAISKAELTTGTATTLRTVRADYLKAGIDELIDGKLPTVPTKLSDLTDDSTHRVVTDTEKTTWNNKSNFSGSYNDLSNKPTIPSSLADLTADASHRTVTDTEKSTWNGKSNFSGSYNDLSNKPSIPAAVAVKGNAESTYRTGNVNLTPANIGACADNDTRLSNSRPASDVYAWAKASSKPSYSWSEISSKPQKFELVASFENTTVKEGYANISKSVTLANYDVLFVVGGAADGQLRVYNAVPTAVALNRTIQNNIYIDKRYYFNIYCTSTTVQLKYISDANLYLTRYIWVYGLKN